MDENSVEKHLLLSRGADSVKKTKTPLFVSWAKWTLKFVIWVVFLAWVAFIFILPAHFVNQPFNEWAKDSSGTVFGTTGKAFMVFSGPVLIIAFLSIVYLIISREEELHERKASTKPKYRLWTFPVLVDGPIGVVSATELIGIVLFVVYVFWALYAFTIQTLGDLSQYQLTSKQKICLILQFLGLHFGTIGLYCLVFLFLPVARGSVLLRLIDIPFEHAIRYHVWLGNLTMLLFTLHGLFYVIEWAIQGELLEEILEWKEDDDDVVIPPGVISYLAGLLMWMTSLYPVRKQKFEFFFYTHQLYVIFVVFLALHVGDYAFSMTFGGIFLFVLDRFMRFCQSRRTVDIIDEVNDL